MLSDLPTPKMYIDDDLDFYDRFTINGKINTVDRDYKPLRQYPLFKAEENTYIFMDFRFFVDKFYQGFLFDFSNITKISFGILKTDMGNYFSEHILLYTVMAKCFSNYGDIRLTGEEIKVKIGSGEPDYYIRKGSDLFLFEFKDILITADIKYSGDPKKIKKGIAEKLEKGSDGKRKGISQLLNTIKNISSNLYNIMEVDKMQLHDVIYYPIIIHTDISLESCGVNYFLNQQMLNLTKEFELSHLKIKGLVLINLDTLIRLQDYFKNGKLILENCINKYLSYISCNNHETATFPFDEFIKYHFVYTNNESIGPPKDFTEIITSFAKH